MTNTTATRRTITTPDGFSVVQVQGKNGLWLTESRRRIVVADCPAIYHGARSVGRCICPSA